jgi:hypothetical protein
MPAHDGSFADRADELRACIRVSQVKREHLTSSKFYFSQLFEAVRV